MRPSVIVTTLSAFLPILLCSMCPTIDPPFPGRLSSPIFTHYEISAKQVNDEYHEIIHLKWIPDSADTIPVTSYQIIRKVDIDSTSTKITNIPADVNEIFDPTYKFITFDMHQNNRLIFYRIFAIDSIDDGRAGDTSAVCTVSLAGLVDLLTPPVDTIPNQSVSFKWQVQSIFNPIKTYIVIWLDDSTEWVSDTIKDYTGGGVPPYERSLPSSHLPLYPGVYFWGAFLTIQGGSITGDDAASIAIRNFYVK